MIGILSENNHNHKLHTNTSSRGLKVESYSFDEGNINFPLHVWIACCMSTLKLIVSRKRVETQTIVSINSQAILNWIFRFLIGFCNCFLKDIKIF